MQYTIRGIPNALDKAMRDRVRVAGRSLNEVVVEVLAEGLGLGKDSVPRRDLSDVAGTWLRDAAAEKAFAAQDHVDKSLWK
ncbi:MAG TPA: hypothetical protein VHL58_19030 [Thermoanaerobaculia bacterium]|nr:hypothetical protein [Thermoanaerobaculia bacterium]